MSFIFIVIVLVGFVFSLLLLLPPWIFSSSTINTACWFHFVLHLGQLDMLPLRRPSNQSTDLIRSGAWFWTSFLMQTVYFGVDFFHAAVCATCTTFKAMGTRICLFSCRFWLLLSISILCFIYKLCLDWKVIEDNCWRWRIKVKEIE